MNMFLKLGLTWLFYFFIVVVVQALGVIYLSWWWILPISLVVATFHVVLTSKGEVEDFGCC
jgi:fatty acid desaturase